MPTGDGGEDVNDGFIYRKTHQQRLIALDLAVKLCWDVKDIKVL